MNLMNRVKTAVGIDPAYNISPNTLDEVERAKGIFLAAAVQYKERGGAGKEDIMEYALAEVWHAAKQYYAQHPEELHECIAL